MAVIDRAAVIRQKLGQLESYTRLVLSNSFTPETLAELKANAKDLCDSAKAELDLIKDDIDELKELRLAGGIINVVSQHLCELGQETEEAFNAEPETLVLGDADLDAQANAMTIEGEVTSADLGAGWVDTGYIEIGVRPKASMNQRNAGIFLIAFNSTNTQVHLQDFTGGGRSGGVIEIPKNSAFQYKITLTPSDSIGGTAVLEVWVGGDSQGEVTLPYGYASTWEENVPGALDEDFSVARLFYSIIADRRGVGGVTYNAEVGEVLATGGGS